MVVLNSITLLQVRTEESSKEAQEAEEARARAKLLKTKQVGHPCTPGFRSGCPRQQIRLSLWQVALLYCRPAAIPMLRVCAAAALHGD